jgi:hypothetical protein
MSAANALNGVKEPGVPSLKEESLKNLTVEQARTQMANLNAKIAESDAKIRQVVAEIRMLKGITPAEIEQIRNSDSEDPEYTAELVRQLETYTKKREEILRRHSSNE